MSRLPIASVAHSNGHGRAEVGHMPTGRQGNLIVTSSKSVSESELRAMLLAEAKKQGKPYGLYFADISSGFAVTTRRSPQAFQVIPLVVYRVYVDGRPDELVRGVSIVGTPRPRSIASSPPAIVRKSSTASAALSRAPSRSRPSLPPCWSARSRPSARPREPPARPSCRPLHPIL